MRVVIAGLGNPGKEYEGSRHNAGRAAVEHLARAFAFGDFILNKKANALVSGGKIGKGNVTLVLPETFMNHSGKAVAAFVKSVKAAKDLIVIHDDLDLPLGTIKFVFNRGSGGHKGVESVMRALKTEAFARIRIGISGEGKQHQAKKVSGEDTVVKHVLSAFSPKEEAVLKKVLKKITTVCELFLTEGMEKAQQEANTR